MAKRKNKMDGVFMEYLPLTYQDRGMDIDLDHHELRQTLKKLAIYLAIGVALLGVEIVVFVLLADSVVKL